MWLQNQPVPGNQPGARQHEIGRGAVDLIALFAAGGATGMTLVTAKRLPLPREFVLPALMPLQVLYGNIVFLVIYELHHYGFINDQRCKSLIEIVEGYCLVPNLIAPVRPTIRPWPQHVWTAVARVIARLRA